MCVCNGESHSPQPGRGDRQRDRGGGHGCRAWAWPDLRLPHAYMRPCVCARICLILDPSSSFQSPWKPTSDGHEAHACSRAHARGARKAAVQTRMHNEGGWRCAHGRLHRRLQRAAGGRGRPDSFVLRWSALFPYSAPLLHRVPLMRDAASCRQHCTFSYLSQPPSPSNTRINKHTLPRLCLSTLLPLHPNNRAHVPGCLCVRAETGTEQKTQTNKECYAPTRTRMKGRRRRHQRTRARNTSDALPTHKRNKRR